MRAGVRAVRFDFDLPRGNNYLCHRKQLFRLHSNLSSVHQAHIMKKRSCRVEMDSPNCSQLLKLSWCMRRNVSYFLILYLMSKQFWSLCWRHLNLAIYIRDNRPEAQVNFRIRFMCTFAFSSHTTKENISNIAMETEKKCNPINMRLCNKKPKVHSG